MVTFPLLQEAKGDLSPVSTLHLVELWEIKLTKLWGLPHEVWSPQTWPHWSSSNFSITVQIFLPQYWFPHRFLLLSFCSGKLWFSLSTLLPLQLLGQQFAQWPHISDRSKNSLFSVFSFLLFTKIECRLPRSLQAGLEAPVNSSIMTYGVNIIS